MDEIISIEIRGYKVMFDKDLSERLVIVEKYLMQYTKDNNVKIDKINEAINYLFDITKLSQIGFKIGG